MKVRSYLVRIQLWEDPKGGLEIMVLTPHPVKEA
jgi:hypothetical protein